MDSQNLCKLLIILFILLTKTSLCRKNPHYLDDRTTMVQLFEWKFDDIALECEQFLGPYGYGGVQISPITENLIVPQRPWWERYQTISYKFVTRSGNETQFKNMVKRCNKAGIRIFVDVILNHMTSTDSYTKDYHSDIVNGTAGTIANPIKKYYPGVPYNSSHFHESCKLSSYQNKHEIINCMLFGLNDLDQSNKYVQDKLVDKLNRMINMGVAGFRIDAAKHILSEQLDVIYNRLDNLRIDYGFPVNSQPFIIQEVPDMGGNEAVRREEYIPIGLVTEFRFGKELTDHIKGDKELKYLKSFGTSWDLMDPTNSLVFIDNHDTQRDNDKGILFKDSKKYKMAVAFMLAHPHSKLPRIMSSFHFIDKNEGPPKDKDENIISPIFNADKSCGNGWVCEHRWRQIYNMVTFKNIVGDEPLTNWWDNGSNQIAFCRGTTGFIAINKYGDLRQFLQTCLPSGIYCDIISGNLENNRCTGKTIRINEHGIGLIDLHGLELDGVFAIHINAKLSDDLNGTCISVW